MAECEWAIVCDYGFFDANRKMCLIGIFDRVLAKSVPTQRQACVALRLIGDPKEQVAIKIELVRPAGGVLAQLTGQTILSDTGAGEFQLNFAGLLLPDWGLYAVTIYLNERLDKTAGFSLSESPRT